jgi:hypothetical protein
MKNVELISELMKFDKDYEVMCFYSNEESGQLLGNEETALIDCIELDDYKAYENAKPRLFIKIS